MKVLFAVNNDNISEAIVKKYQKEYKEIISGKNVYYFNAILKELQNNKTYDRIVISEDLEPFANNNYDTIDKFLFEKLDKISDEATKASGEDIEIILVCSDRRSKSDEMLAKIFGIGIYNALIGEERHIETLCKLLHQPRTKKEAKKAYKIEANNVLYQIEDENSVSESEVQNILVHYKRLGKNEDKYVDSFNNIVSQYTDAQLRIIIKYLPLHVKAVLEEQSPKYQELSTFSVKHNNSKEPYRPRNLKTIQQEEKINVKMLDNEKGRITKPILIPTTLNNKKTAKVVEQKNEVKVEEPKTRIDEDIIEVDKTIQEEPKRGRGRPRKNPVEQQDEEKPKRGRGRPKKVVETSEEEIDLFNINTEEDSQIQKDKNIEPDELNFDIFNMESDEKNNNASDEEVDLFNMGTNQSEEQEDDDSENVHLFSMDVNQNEEKTDENIDLFNMSETEENDVETLQEDSQDYNLNLFNLDNNQKHEIESTVRQEVNLSSLLTREKKMVSFVGTTKNGTSFIVNNLALLLSSMNISTAILDTTQSKNAYYIFTKNEENLRTVASSSILNLERGVAEGIEVNKNLTVYTEVPGEYKAHENIEKILVTLMEKHEIVLIDADFNTPTEYFQNSQEIYLVQSMDILTIQPLTAFLRDLKAKNILQQEKIKVVINKDQKVRSLSERVLIGGISSYNDPSMAFMTELFNKDDVKSCKIPFEIQNYVKYLESLVNCEISLKGYTKQFLNALNELAGMVYPLLNKSKYSSKEDKRKRMQFSDQTNNTLNKMRKNY